MPRILLAALLFGSAARLAGSTRTLKLGTPREIPPHFIGANGNMLSRPKAWSEPAMIDAFAATGARLFRYPAGTLANTWDWDRDWLDADVPAEDLIDWVRAFDRGPDAPHRYPLTEVAKLHRATGTTVVFVLNMLTKDLDHSVRGLRRARELGLPIRYVEMGNELYFNLPLESRVFPTPEDYGRRCNEWIKALKVEFPGVKCGIVAGGRPNHVRSGRWTERALSACPNADAVIVHVYSPSGLLGTRTRELAPGQEGVVARSADEPVAARQERELHRLRTDEGFGTMMRTAYAAGLQTDIPNLPANVEIWATEWNLRGDREAIRGTWAQALYNTVWMHALVENPRVTLTHLHNLIGPNFAALFTGRKELNHVLGQPHDTEPFAPTAAGLALSFFARTATGHTQATPLFATGAGAEKEQPPAVFGWQFSGGPQAVAGLVVNLSATPWVGTTSAALPPGTRLETYTAPVDHYVRGRNSVVPGKAVAGESITLPPRSVTLLTYPRA